MAARQEIDAHPLMNIYNRPEKKSGTQEEENPLEFALLKEMARDPLTVNCFEHA
jgi:hypothetical protein